MYEVLRGSGQRLAAGFGVVTTSRSGTGLFWKKNTYQIERMLSSNCRLMATVNQSHTWLRAAQPWEAEMDAWNRNHTRYGIMGMTFNSKAALPEDFWKQALRHIYMQTQILQLDMVQRGDEKWLCEVSDMDLNVKLVEDQPLSEVYDTMFKEGIDKSPWHVRIVPAKPNDICVQPAIKEEYPYQYYCMALSNHAISDAQSSMLIARRMLELLGDIVIRRNYSDRLPFVKITNGEELRQVRSNMITKLVNDSEKLQKEKEILQSTIKTPLLNEAFSFLVDEPVTTKYSHHMLEEKNHQLFEEKCKHNGIRISSGVIAAINTAIIEMVKDAGLQREFYHISIMQNADMRRYLKNKYDIGYLQGRIHQSYQIPTTIRKEFWNHGKDINSRTYELLKSNGPLVQEAVCQLTLPPKDPAAKRGPQQMDWDYTFNNILDLTPALYVPSDQVQITDLFPCNMTHNFVPFQIIFYTFCGVAKLSLSYSTDCLTEDMAQELMDRVLSVIRDMAFSSKL